MIYEQLKAACEPTIEHYVEDLTKHDRTTLELQPGVPFLHWTRPTGTNIVMLRAADTYPAEGVYVPYLFGEADREHMLNAAMVITQESNRDQRHLLIHYFDGHTLRRTSVVESVAIVKEYQRRIREQWARPLVAVA